jgi:hypothetical protein
VSRRRKLPPMPPGYIRAFSIAVVCTGHDRHPRAAIANLSGAALPGGDPADMWQQTQHGESVTGWMQADGWRTFRFACGRCGRDVRLREPNVIAAAAALRAADTTQSRPVLDISLL